PARRPGTTGRGPWSPTWPPGSCTCSSGARPLRQATPRPWPPPTRAAPPPWAVRSPRVLATLPASYVTTPAAVDTAELAEELELLADPPGPGAVRYRVDPSGDGAGLGTVRAADRPGTLARTTGVLALHRVSVLRAHVWSTSAGLALQRFAVQAPATLRCQPLGG